MRDLVIDIGQPVPLGTFTHEDVKIVNGNPRITVPECFVTDFSSVPKIFRPLYLSSSVDLAGCVHDRAYRIQTPRKAADQMWEIVATSGATRRNRIGPVRGRLGYWALRTFGIWAYRSNAKKGFLVQPCGEGAEDSA